MRQRHPYVAMHAGAKASQEAAFIPDFIRDPNAGAPTLTWLLNLRTTAAAITEEQPG